MKKPYKGLTSVKMIPHYEKDLANIIDELINNNDLTIEQLGNITSYHAVLSKFYQCDLFTPLLDDEGEYNIQSVEVTASVENRIPNSVNLYLKTDQDAINIFLLYHVYNHTFTELGCFANIH